MNQYKIFESKYYDKQIENETQTLIEEQLIKKIKDLPQKQVFPLLRSKELYHKFLVNQIITDKIKVESFIAVIHRNDIERFYFSTD